MTASEAAVKPDMSALVELDELMDARLSGPTSAKPGTPYYLLSIRCPGKGTAEVFINRGLHDQIRLLGLERGDAFLLDFGLQKFSGRFEPRIVGISAAV
jgi:hypothetical protein